MNSKGSNTLQALWLGIGSLSSFGLAIVSTAILSRYFSKSDYGTYRQILYVYNTLLVLFSAGLPTVFSYYLPRYTLNEGKDIVWKLSKILFVTGVIFSVTLFFASGFISRVLKNPALDQGLTLFSPIPMLLLPTLGIDGIFTTYNKTIYVAIFNVLTKLTSLFCIVIPVVIFNGNLHSSIYGWQVASLLTLLLALYFKNLPYKGIELKKSGIKVKDFFSYSIPLVTAFIWGMAIKAADEFYISRYFGSEVFGEFSNGFIELPFVTMVTASTAAVLLPLFSKMMHDNLNTDSIVEVWKNALLKSATIIYPTLVFFIFYAKNIILILYSSKYESSTLYFQIAMLLNFFNIIIFAPILFAMGKTKFYSNLHLWMAILEWAVGFIVVTTFNTPISIAIMSVTLAIIKVMIAFYYTSTLIKVSVFKLFPIKQIILYLIHSVLVIFVIKLILQYSNFTRFDLMELIISLVGYVILLLLTARIFKLEYLSIFKPILLKLSSYAKKT
jgi:O-antigen/teichoic acid export membrane protein